MLYLLEIYQKEYPKFTLSASSFEYAICLTDNMFKDTYWKSEDVVMYNWNYA